MSLSRLQKYINIDFLNFFLIAFFSIYSIYIVSYHYDGHHIGLVYSNALDLINGKHPYKEIFIQYGFLTTLVHASILILFDNKVIFLSIFTVIFYSFSILLTITHYQCYSPSFRTPVGPYGRMRSRRSLGGSHR